MFWARETESASDEHGEGARRDWIEETARLRVTRTGAENRLPPATEFVSRRDLFKLLHQRSLVVARTLGWRPSKYGTAVPNGSTAVDKTRRRIAPKCQQLHGSVERRPIARLVETNRFSSRLRASMPPNRKRSSGSTTPRFFTRLLEKQNAMGT